MVTVHKKDGSHLNEIMILDLHAPYTIVHQKDDKATLDIHIKIDDANKLLRGLIKVLGLKQALENQVVSPSVDR